MGTSLPPYGSPAECPPQEHPLAKPGVIAWSWFPAWSWLKVFLLLSVVLMAIGIIVIVFSIAAGVIVLIIGALAFFIFLNWKFNADKQMAYRIARGKSITAMQLWSTVDDLFQYQAKDTFYETKYGGKTLRVLRDGTIEIMGSHENLDVGINSSKVVASSGADFAANV
jgi:hypothetical protein